MTKKLFSMKMTSLEINFLKAMEETRKYRTNPQGV